jgi:hypothetical protein
MEKRMRLKELIVVSHTHWDREWYGTFQNFRARLTRMIRELLRLLETDARFKAFTLDGQTIMLEDHLEVHPEDRPRLKALVKKKRLDIGPWYLQPDEFLVSGEALIRNLQTGHKISREFGGVMKVGYVPDTFGHISQLPQIFNGFGINSFIYSRGFPREKESFGPEFWWIAPDGRSRVLASTQVGGYCGGARLGYPGHVWDPRLDTFSPRHGGKRVKGLIRQAGRHGRVPVLLVCNGCDHQHPQDHLPQMLAHLRGKLKLKVTHGHYQDFVDRVLASGAEFSELAGELRSSTSGPVLQGVLSTRQPLKNENHELQVLLERWLEPMAALAALQGRPYPAALVEKAWKLLMLNHPHDSICGCSAEQVHVDMVPRFEQCRQLAGMLLDESLATLAAKADTRFVEKIPKARGAKPTAVVFFNPIAEPRRAPFRAALRFRVDPKDPFLPGLKLKDAAGREAGVQVLSSRRESVNQGRAREWYDAYDILSDAPLPALGAAAFAACPAEPKAGAVAGVKAGAGGCETGQLKVDFQANGTFTVLHKASGRLFKDQNLLQDCADAGDTYNFSPLKGGGVLTSARARSKTRLVSAGPVAALYEVEVDWRLPVSLEAKRKARCRETAPCQVVFEILVPARGDCIEIEARWDNQARDHRLRAVFPAPFKAGFTSALGHFDVVDRPLNPPAWKPCAEAPRPEFPNQGWISISDRNLGLTVMNQGLLEYQGLAWPGGTALALTLLRCVGWLSRDDLSSRDFGAGPAIATPGAQCLGTQKARYAVCYHQGGWEAAGVFRQAEAFQAGVKARSEGLHEGSLGSSHSFLQSAHPAARISAVQGDEKGGLRVRAWNIGTKPCLASLVFDRPLKRARRVNLLGFDQGAIRAEGSKAALPLRQKEIATIQI